MSKASLLYFLCFSQALGAAHDSQLSRSGSGDQHPRPYSHGNNDHGQEDHWKGWPGKHGSMPASGSIMSSPMPASTTPCEKTEPMATLDCGVVTGTTTSLPAATATVNKFLGIPFAQSPPERFGLPQRPGSCNVNATAWKPACIQQFTGSKAAQAFTNYVFNNPAPEESEDCLYLNVYAPSSPPPADGRAVMFWIYGGALQFGNAGQQYYDGSWFAGYEDVIIVTTNYRTNVFGFATSPELPITQRNLGFYDQRFALDWVQRNIAAFGGSPEKVTIFGESAGGFSVDAMLTSYPKNSKPPFRGAIMESGQISYNAQKRLSTVPQWNALAGLLECPGSYGSNLTCLRAANASAIKNAIEMNDLEFNPVGDNVTLVKNPMQQRLSGNIAHIPILGGSNSQEGRVFAVGQTNTTAFLSAMLGNNTAAIKALESVYPPYRAATGEEAYDQSSEIFTESVFQCTAAMLANATASIGIPSWRYYFNASFHNTQPYPKLGVYHSSEIPIVFSTYPRMNVTTQEYALSRAMRGAWATFAKNPAGGPGWNPTGTGMESDVLVGPDAEAMGGIFMAENGTNAMGPVSLAVFGNRGDALGSGIAVIDSNEVDSRCWLYGPTYEMNAIVG